MHAHAPAHTHAHARTNTPTHNHTHGIQAASPSKKKWRKKNARNSQSNSSSAWEQRRQFESQTPDALTLAPHTARITQAEGALHVPRIGPAHGDAQTRAPPLQEVVDTPHLVAADLRQLGARRFKCTSAARPERPNVSKTKGAAFQGVTPSG